MSERITEQEREPAGSVMPGRDRLAFIRIPGAPVISASGKLQLNKWTFTEHPGVLGPAVGIGNTERNRG